MEWYVIFVYELGIGYVLGVFVQMLLVVLCGIGFVVCIGVFGGFGDIFDWGVELDIEDFVFYFWLWLIVFFDWDVLVQIVGDVLVLQFFVIVQLFFGD